MSCCNSDSKLPEQSEFNCLPTHLGSFCPPVCKKCCPCPPDYCDCPTFNDCDPCCKLNPCVKRYERVRYVQQCNLELPKSCCPPCDITPKRRESYKPIYICKTQTTPLNYDTVYRRSFDIATYNPPPY